MTKVKAIINHRFCHTVMQACRGLCQHVCIQRFRLQPTTFRDQGVFDPPFDAPDGKKPAIVRNVCRFTCPSRNCPQSGDDGQRNPLILLALSIQRRPVVEQRSHTAKGLVIRCLVHGNKMLETCLDCRHWQAEGLKFFDKLLSTKR